MFSELLNLATSNLLRARARLIMTAGGVLVGTAAVILLIALTIGLQTVAEAGIGSADTLTTIYVYPNYGDPQLTGKLPQLDNDAVKAFWQIPGVAAVVPVLYLQGPVLVSGDLQNYPQFIGLDPALLPYLNLSVSQGVLSLNSGEMIAGGRVAESFFDPTSTEYQPITLDLFTEPIRLRVNKYTDTGQSVRRVDSKFVGQLTVGTNFDNSVFMPFNDVYRLNEWVQNKKYDPKEFKYDQIIVRAKDRNATNAISDAIKKLGYQAGGAGDFLNALNGFFGTMRLMLGGIGAVALLVAAFGVANTMTMAILERTKEIGLMKAIGATDRNILTIFLLESGLVGLVGGLSGVAVALVLQDVVNRAVQNVPSDSPVTSFLPLDPSKIGGNLMIIPSELIVFSLVLATCVGLVAGFFPALRAANLPPVIALKSE
ncbi:MAG: ABC transporter permease [Anaerolineae bacterium]